MTEFPQPDINDTNRPFWNGLREGKLLFQRCAHGHNWLPARDFCPVCLSPQASFVQASGRAKVVSWVVYNTAFNDAFKNRLPYNVSLIELEEGPRMLTNVICEPASLAANLPVMLAVEWEGEGDGALAVARFKVAA